jgi:hypothetical protein
MHKTMKKIISILFLLVIGSTISYAQIGIYTSNPQTLFHIDGAKDNAASGVPSTAQQANDVVITKEGRLGIGTNTPANNLEVNSGTARVSGVKMTQLPSASILSTDASGNIISGNSESAGVSVTKQRLVAPNSAIVLDTGSGNYSFRYFGYNTTTFLGGYWQIKVNNGAARQFNVWDVEYGGAGGAANVYQARNVVTYTPNVWSYLNSGNGAGGSNEYNVYHVFDSATGVVIRFTCTLSNMDSTPAGVREAMISEEF